jgi:hypothetical protein
MPREVFTPTDDYVEAKDVAAVFTIDKAPTDGTLFINDVASDTAALKINGRTAVGVQFEQRSAKSTFIKASGDGTGWKIVVDDGTA